MAKKILFTDLDGTLLDDEKNISTNNRAAVDKALAQRHSVVITTGRPLLSAIEQAEALGMTGEGCYLIAFNGGILYDTFGKRIVFAQPISVEAAYRVFDEANAAGLHIQTYEGDDIVVEPRCDDAALKKYRESIHVPKRVVSSVREVRTDPMKCLLIDFQSHERLVQFQKKVDEIAGDVLDSFFSNDYYLEIVPKGMNKGASLRRMANMLGVPIENTVAVGDAPNDLSMVEAAGIGAAMCNGTDDVKAIADYVTVLDNNHSGVAEVIEKFILATD